MNIKIKFKIIVASAIMSLNHKMAPKVVRVKPRLKKIPPKLNPWKYITAPNIKVRSEKETKIGHGEGSTKW